MSSIFTCPYCGVIEAKDGKCPNHPEISVEVEVENVE